MKIVKCRSSNDEEWDEIWTKCNYATYFHSREWVEIWSDYTREDEQPLLPSPKLIKFSDGKKALLPLSFYSTHRGLIKNYVSSPVGTFGGWISVDELSLRHNELLTLYLLKNFPSLTWQLNPYDEKSLQLKPDNSIPGETSTLPLKEDFDYIFRRWSKGHKAAVNQAKRGGVVITQATHIAEWKEYFKIYQDSIRRWGEKVTSNYSWQLFDKMHKKKSPNIKLWIASKDEKIIAGALCFYSKKHAVYWHGAALEEYFNLRPVNLLMYEAIKRAHSNGYEW